MSPLLPMGKDKFLIQEVLLTPVILVTKYRGSFHNASGHGIHMINFEFPELFSFGLCALHVIYFLCFMFLLPAQSKQFGSHNSAGHRTTLDNALEGILVM